MRRSTKGALIHTIFTISLCSGFFFLVSLMGQKEFWFGWEKGTQVGAVVVTTTIALTVFLWSKHNNRPNPPNAITGG